MSQSLPTYLDNHATTPVDSRVLQRMLPYFSESFGNAASVDHQYGWTAREAVDESRSLIARLVGSSPRDIVFTSGATESDNLALLGTATGRADRGRHMISVVTEHKAVLDPLRALEAQGWEVTYLPVDSNGQIDMEQLSGAIRMDTALVSVMAVNNEIGIEHPISEIAEIVGQTSALFHTDAAQALGYRRLNMSELQIDLMSMSSHKIYGPKGVGALYVSPRAAEIVAPIIHGGGHERGLRSGTLDTPGIVGFGESARLVTGGSSAFAASVSTMRDRFETRLRERVTNIEIVGSRAVRHPGNSLVIFRGVPAQALLNRLRNDLAASTGSACTSATPEPSHVLTACGYTHDDGMSAIRFGIGRQNTVAEIDQATDAIAHHTDLIRSALADAKTVA